MVFMMMRYRISHTHSCGFISFQNTHKFCLNFVGCNTHTRRNSRPTMRRVMNTASLIQQFFFFFSRILLIRCFFFKNCVPTSANVVHTDGECTLRRTRRTLSTDAPFSRAHVMNAHASYQNLTVKDVWIVCLRALVESQSSKFGRVEVLSALIPETSAQYFSESKNLRYSAKRSLLWPTGRAEPSHRLSPPSHRSQL